MGRQDLNVGARVERALQYLVWSGDIQGNHRAFIPMGIQSAILAAVSILSHSFTHLIV